MQDLVQHTQGLRTIYFSRIADNPSRESVADLGGAPGVPWTKYTKVLMIDQMEPPLWLSTMKAVVMAHP